MVDLSKFKETFIQEAEDNIQKLNKDLLLLEGCVKKGDAAGQKNLF
jgi:chemotaxis protein histidine kinase CheA